MSTENISAKSQALNIGITFYPSDADSTEPLINQAEKELFESKNEIRPPTYRTWNFYHSLIGLGMLDLAVIGVWKVYCRQGIVARDAIFYRQNGGRGFSMLKEQGIMPHTQS